MLLETDDNGIDDNAEIHENIDDRYAYPEYMTGDAIEKDHDNMLESSIQEIEYSCAIID